jgi:Domain of unknown function (DUF4349)
VAIVTQVSSPDGNFLTMAVRQSSMTKTHLTRFAAIAATSLLFVACGSSKKSATSATTSVAPPSTFAAATTAAASVDVGAGGKVSTGAGAAVATTLAPGGGQPALGGIEPKIVTTTTMDLEVDDVLSANLKIQALIQGAGGRISNEQTSLGKNSTTTLVAKVPPSKLGGLLTLIGDTGKVLHRTQQSDDVTAQYVDLDARIISQRTSVARISELYAKAASVDELARLEGELTRRQTELEQMLGQKNVLESRIADSTLTLSLHPVAEAEEVVKAKPRPGLGRAFTNSLRALGRAIVDVVYALLVALPWLVSLAVIGLPLLWLIRRQNAKAKARLVAAKANAKQLPPPTAGE